MRTLIIFVLTLTLTACPKEKEVLSPVIETPDEKEARELEAQLAALYERFVETCRQQPLIGEKELFLSCSNSLGYAIEGYPNNACMGWSWLSREALTQDAWNGMMEDIDKARTGLTQLWLELSDNTRGPGAVIARGMNPDIMDPNSNWYCPAPP
jgi:hypothetical protein